MTDRSDNNKDKLPLRIKDWPPYICSLTKSFFVKLFYIFSLVWETSPAILIILSVIAVVQGFLPVAGAFLSKNIINALQMYSGVESGKFITVIWLLIAFFIYRFFESIISKLDTAIKRVSGDLVVNTTKLKIMKKSAEIDIEKFDMPDFYEKLENANREATNRPIMILGAAFSLFSAAISLVSFIIIISQISIWAALLMFVLSMPSAIINYKYRRKTFEYMKRRSKERRQLNYYSDLTVNKDYVKEIRLFGLVPTFTQRYKAVFKKYFNGLKKLIIRENLWHTVISVLSTAVSCVFFAIIAYKCFQGDIKIGDYTYYTGALTSVVSYVTMLIGFTSTIYEGTLFVDNLIDFLKEKRTVKSINEVPAKIVRGKHTVEFAGVYFKYPGSDRYVLNNINFRIEEGQTVVLVGLNGAGKTTLIKLLTRLYDPTEGKILLDGTDIKEYEPEELYKIYGIIFQDFGRYAETVSDNISFGNINIPKDENRITASAKSSSIDEYIEKLPKKYDTSLMRVFEQDGTELSLGQWQKIAVARAFYADSDILILDEPTASLDAIAEQEIYNEFEKLRNGKISVFVSHRLSSATIADKIIVLDRGSVAEIGNHKELMQKKGIYYKLFNTQAQRYIEKDEY